ncbi:MAG: agmatine deiminase family protein [Verrucomicrobiota bacterium]
MFEQRGADAVKPAALGYRMPAEWEPHAATWLSWPRPEGISFPDSYERVMPAFAKMVDALADSEPVCINVWNAAHEAEVRSQLTRHGARSEHVRFYHHPAHEPWCRDHGPIFLKRAAAPETVIVDWAYNAWGGKYPPYDLDDAVPTRVAELLELPVYGPEMILEGGSIEVNGSGTLLTTTSCLLNPNRNPHLSKEQIEGFIREYLGVSNILWLGDGIEGDDTDGHIDDLTRFVNRTTVVTVLETDHSDPNHEPLQENLRTLEGMRLEDGSPLQVLRLPMPARIDREDLRLPASYANFYIGNKVVLLPVFADPNDARAIEVLQSVFPERQIVPIDCRELIWGLGAFHCLTQQQPA